MATLTPTRPGTIIVDLPPRFYEDHVARDLAAGEVRKETAKYVRVEIDLETFEEILSDARHYADPYGPDVDVGLKSSARATVKRLEAYGPEDFRVLAEPRWETEVGKHTLRLEDGQSTHNPASTHRRIYGPCTITYTIFEDGGIDFYVDEDER